MTTTVGNNNYKTKSPENNVCDTAPNEQHIKNSLISLEYIQPSQHKRQSSKIVTDLSINSAKIQSFVRSGGLRKCDEFSENNTNSKSKSRSQKQSFIKSGLQLCEDITESEGLSGSCETSINKEVEIVSYDECSLDQPPNCDTSDNYLRFNHSKDRRFNDSKDIVSFPLSKQKENRSDFEFFKLTLLSHQLNNKKRFKTLSTINVDNLYQQARFDEKLGFNQYSEFITKELEKYYLLKTKNADPTKFLGREADLVDYRGAKLYIDASYLTESQMEMSSSLKIQVIDEDTKDEGKIAKLNKIPRLSTF